MEQHGVAHDGQSQPGAAVVARAAFADAVEPLEESGQVFFCHTGACVVVAEIAVGVVLVVALDADGGALAGVADAVLDEVAEDGVDEGVVSFFFHVFRYAVGDFHLGFVEPRAEFFDDVVHDAAQVQGLALHGVGGFFCLGDERDVADEVRQPHDLGVGFFQEIFLSLGAQVVAGEEGFYVAADAADGGAQLVGDVVAHLLFEQLVLFGTGDVGQCHFKAAVAVDEQLQAEVVAAGGEGVAEDGGAVRIGIGPAVEVEELYGGGEDGLLPDGVDVGRGAVEQGIDVLHETRVGIDLAPVGGEDGYAFLEVVEVAHEAFALRGDLSAGLFELLVLLHDGAADVAQFGMGKRDVRIVYKPAVGRIDEVPEAGNGFAELVGEVDEYDDDNGKDDQDEPKEDVVRLQEGVDLVIVGLGQAHDETAVGLGEIIIVRIGRR